MSRLMRTTFQADSRRTRALALALFAAVCLPFLPSLSGGFLQWDDADTLLKTQAWRGFAPGNFRWMLTTLRLGPWQPMSWLSYALDYDVAGLNPFAFRATNLLIHAGAATACFFLFMELAGVEAAAAAFGAFVFAVHPLRVESVCWITERRDVLCGLFYVVSLFFYVRRKLFPCWLAFVAACLSKATALTLPLTLLLLDVWPLRRKAVAEKIPFFLVSLLVGVIAVLGQRDAGLLRGLAQTGAGERAALSVYGLWFYLSRTFVPLGLAPFYPVPVGFRLFSPLVLGAAAGLVSVAAAAWVLRRRAPALGATLIQHALACAPALGAVRFGFHLVADRYSYLAGIAWGALAAVAYARAPRGAVRSVVAAAVVLALGVQSARLSLSWRDDLSLWTRGAALYPNALQANANLAHALRESGRDAEAAEHERLAVAEDPLDARLRNNYGSWLLSQGKIDAAREQLERAVVLDPTSAAARQNLGMTLGAAGHLKEGVAQLEVAVRFAPHSADALNDLGLALIEAGDPRRAEVFLRRAVAESPSWAVVRYNLGNALAALGRRRDAVAAFADAVRLDPTLEPAWVNGGNALALDGRLAEAEKYFARALALNPNDAAAHANLAAVRRAR